MTVNSSRPKIGWRAPAPAVALAIALFLSTSGTARAAAADPADAVRSFEAAMRVTAPASDAARAEIESRLRDALDMAAMVQIALGDHAASASPAQVERLADALLLQMAATFTGGLTADTPVMFNIVETREISGTEWLVTTRTDIPDNDPAVLMWRVRDNGGNPQIVDTMQDGVSMLVALREELDVAIRRDGLEAAIVGYEARAAEAATN
jgi:ABC-type transporter MlaC component